MGGNIVIEYTGESFSSTIFMTEGILTPLVKAARKRQVPAKIYKIESYKNNAV